ncbi:penta-EF hand domain-containing protein 2-like isoform X2 [Telopea speciosissima]|uniref:penta-EF hand domain-containing protein 2-like isoform X2 n=1 Tax=Telopea speciosissima TaxID=54955 RepID=UPI001CC713CF|nr:penta-EF hand domain-containing protein 2-like isoform X2 [Telopea speciosissima]
MENTANLREWFQRVDSNNKGSITAPELKSALAVGNLEFPLSVVEQMIRMYDFDRNGTMSFQEFVALNKFLLKVQQAFSDLERGRGFLVPDDVYDSFDQKKNGRFQLDDVISLCIFLQSARNLFNSFDTAKQGRVTLDFNQLVYCAANCRI